MIFLVRHGNPLTHWNWSQGELRETYRRERATGSMVRTLSTKWCPSRIPPIIVVLISKLTPPVTIPFRRVRRPALLNNNPIPKSSSTQYLPKPNCFICLEHLPIHVSHAYCPKYVRKGVKPIIIIIYSLNFPYLRVLALSICPNRTVSSVLNIYQFMCPMPTVLNMSEKS